MSDADEGRVRPFADFLAEHNNGAGHREAGEKLKELVQAVLDTGKKGSLTLKVGVVAMDDTTLVTTVEVTSTLPKVAAKGAVFYADAEGNLTRTDPSQLTFDSLKEVPAPTAEIKDVPAAPEPVAIAGGEA